MFSTSRTRHRRRRWLPPRLAVITAAAGLALAGLSLPALADDPDPVPAPPTVDAPPANPGNPTQAALIQAQSTGQPVPVDSLTTQTSTTTANPDGTLTSTIDTQPVRVQQNGTWTPVDATLALNDDGTYSPKATPSAVALSGGGTVPLAAFTDPAGHTLTLTMPFALPAPTVTGSTALYADVLPGVDLQASVTDQGGFSDALIIHSAAAAANPALASLTLTTSTNGLTLNADSTGGLTATAADGSTVFLVPPAQMWDSAAPQTTAPQTTRTRLATKAAMAADDDPGPTQPSSPDGPGTSAHVADVPMTVGSGAVTLTPDTGMLTSPDTTWPVYVDPGVVTETTSHYTEVQEGCPSPQYDNPQPNGEGAGYQQYSPTCFGLERSFFQINTSALSSAMKIIKAQLNLSETWGADQDCSHTLPLTVTSTNAISSSTIWPGPSKLATNDPEYISVPESVKSANITSGCGDQTVGPIVTTAIAGVAASNDNSWTFGLYGDESETSSNYGLMRFAHNPSIQVNYDIAPDAPTNLSTNPEARNNPTTTGTSSGCGSSSSYGFIGQTTAGDIALNATLTSNISGETVKGDFEFWDDQTNDGSGNPTVDSTPDTAYYASNTPVSVDDGTTVQDGHEYGWKVRAYDGSQYSSYTADCHFAVDLTPPTPTVVQYTSSAYPPVGPITPAPDPTGHLPAGDIEVSSQDPIPAGCTATLGTCKSSGLYGFLWSLDEPIPTSGAAFATAVSGAADIALNPSGWGTHILYVQAIDNAGNRAQPTSYTFYAPWNPNQPVTAGDVNGDGIPDLLATTTSGDLELIGGNHDPSISPTIISYKNQSPDSTASAQGTPWNDFLLAHRGSVLNQGVDDLFALAEDANNKPTNLYLYENQSDVTNPTLRFADHSNVVGPLQRPECVATDDPGAANGNADNCDTPGAVYNNADWSDVTQMIAIDATNDGRPDLITMENGNLWLFRGSSQQDSFVGPHSGGTSATTPVLLGTGDWSRFTLLAPGNVGAKVGTLLSGTPTLWARDNTTGTLYTFDLTPDSDHLPPMLTAPLAPSLISALPQVGGKNLCLDDKSAATANYNPVQIYTCNATGAQSWTAFTDGTVRTLGHCLDVKANATAPGTLVDLYTCNGTTAQTWTVEANGSLKNPHSGLCLNDPGAGAPGTQLTIDTCDGLAQQNWASLAPASWSAPADEPTALPLTLPVGTYPTVVSPGDVNSPTADGTPDGNPDLYAITSAGQISEFPGAAPDSTTGTPQFTPDPVTLGYDGMPTDRWQLNEASGATAADAASAANSATLHGDAAFTTWGTHSASDPSTPQQDQALSLDGITGTYAESAATSVPTGTYTDPVDRTTQDPAGFTVSAWVKLTNSTQNSTFVSQNDAATPQNTNAFQLYYSAGAGVWAFNRHNDNTADTSFSAVYGAQAQTGVWTQLTGVYTPHDPADTSDPNLNGTLSLYVNGILSASGAFTGSPWASTGQVEIGRCFYQGAWGNSADADVADVQMYSTALDPMAVAALAHTPNEVTQLS